MIPEGEKKMRKEVPVLELCIASWLFMFGFSIYNKPEILQNVPPIYDWIGRYTTVNLWTFIFCLVALFILVGIGLSNRPLRTVGNLGAALLFGMAAAGAYSAAKGYSLAGGVYTTWCFLALWSTRHAKED